MQGKLQEIDIRSILQLIQLGQRTGELFVEASVSQYWFVFFLNGRIIYASESDGSVTRLRDYLRRFQAEGALDRVQSPPKASTNAPEYAHLWALLEAHQIDPGRGKQIVGSMIQEVLFDLLSLHQGSFIFESASPLAPQLAAFEIGPLIKGITSQVQEWKKLHPYVQSPDQFFTITNPNALQQSLPPQIYETFQKWSDGNTNIRQMSRYLGRNILTVGKAMYPYIQQGIIQLSEVTQLDGERPVNTGSDRTPHIVCIDDSMAIQKTVEYILEGAGYKVTSIDNPLKALGQVFLIRPDMILCDVAMPKLDGYDLCAMLRKSTAFRQTPMVMLTGKDGFTDRIKARMAGANDFLTKPFGEKELLTVIESYVGVPPEVDVAEGLAASSY